MAVPKKRTSKAKTRTRKDAWFAKAEKLRFTLLDQSDKQVQTQYKSYKKALNELRFTQAFLKNGKRQATMQKLPEVVKTLPKKSRKTFKRKSKNNFLVFEN